MQHAGEHKQECAHGKGRNADGVRCAWDSATDCSISTFHLSLKLSSNAKMPPTGRRPLPRLFGLHTVPRHRGPVEAHGGEGVLGLDGRYSHSFMQGGAPQGPGYLRSAPAAQVLFEPAAQLGSPLLKIGSLERCSF